MRGEEVSTTELQRRYKAGHENYGDPLQIRKTRYLDLDKPYVQINHSCAPNATVVRRCLIAIKDIKPNQEILYDYSLTEWSAVHLWKGWDQWAIDCGCGAPRCRKTIVHFPELPAKLQADAIRRGLVPSHIVRQYESHRSAKAASVNCPTSADRSAAV
jgi:hypothetical protein